MRWMTVSISSFWPRAAVTLSVLRPVATTALPAASAAFPMSTPMPRPAPVMNHTCVFVVRIASSGSWNEFSLATVA